MLSFGSPALLSFKIICWLFLSHRKHRRAAVVCAVMRHASINKLPFLPRNMTWSRCEFCYKSAGNMSPAVLFKTLHDYGSLCRYSTVFTGWCNPQRSPTDTSAWLLLCFFSEIWFRFRIKNISRKKRNQYYSKNKMFCSFVLAFQVSQRSPADTSAWLPSMRIWIGNQRIHCRRHEDSVSKWTSESTNETKAESKDAYNGFQCVQ